MRAREFLQDNIGGSIGYGDAGGNWAGSGARFKQMETPGDHDTDDSSITLDPHRGDYEIRNYHKLDKYLAELCDLIEKGQASDKDYGMVAAGILTLKYPYMARLNRPGKHGRIHAEHAVIEDFKAKYGEVPEGTVIITTLSPCNKHMDERDGPACADIINDNGIKKVYCGYLDPTQHAGQADHRHYNLIETSNSKLRSKCQEIAETFLDAVDENMYNMKKPELGAEFVANTAMGENFADTFLEDIKESLNEFAVSGDDDGKEHTLHKYARMWYNGDHHTQNQVEKILHRMGWGISEVEDGSDAIQLVHHEDINGDDVVTFMPDELTENFADGRNPQDKGDSKRYHVPTKGSVSSLRKFAKGHHGRAAQLAHWMANMKSGHKK